MRLILILILFFSLFFLSCDREVSTDSASNEIVAAPEPLVEYGIVVDSLKVIRDKIQKNEFLADILLRHGVDYATIDNLARNTRDTFDVRKIRRGNNYALICTADSIENPLYFVYEISASSYVLYRLFDSVYATKGHKIITTTLDSISGNIQSSLWNALVDQNADPNLANEMSEIYAWTIDFFGLQKKDAFSLIYDRNYVEDIYLGLGRIYAASFMHKGDTIYAFYFEQNGKGDYFDEKGNSLQRTFLKAPLRYSRISSGFSNSRLHPVLKIRRPHHGIDYAAPTGTPVHTVGDGEVIKKGYQKNGGGNYIKIKHNGTYSTTYMHLKGFAKGMVIGKRVKQGDLIGYVGSTGLATGPHLDFRFYRNGKAVNPLKVESPPSKPIDSAFLADFNKVVNLYKVRLDSISKLSLAN